MIKKVLLTSAIAMLALAVCGCGSSQKTTSEKIEEQNRAWEEAFDNMADKIGEFQEGVNNATGIFGNSGIE